MKMMPMTPRSRWAGFQVTPHLRIAPMMMSAMLPPLVTDQPPTLTIAACSHASRECPNCRQDPPWLVLSPGGISHDSAPGRGPRPPMWVKVAIGMQLAAWRWSGRLAGLLAFIARRDPGELARRLGGAAVKGSLDHREYRAMQRGGQQDRPPPLLFVGGLRRVISPADDLPDLLEDQAGEQAAQRAGDQVHLLVQQLDHRLPPALAVSRGYLSKGGSGYSGGEAAVFCCHGQRPVSSTSSEKLRNVRIKTMMASTATLVRVGWPATVWIMSPATSSSRPSRMLWPSCWRKRR